MRDKHTDYSGGVKKEAKGPLKVKITYKDQVFGDITGEKELPLK